MYQDEIVEEIHRVR